MSLHIESYWRMLTDRELKEEKPSSCLTLSNYFHLLYPQRTEIITKYKPMHQGWRGWGRGQPL